MATYSLRDVERVLRLPSSTIRGLIKAGFVNPARGARRAYLFSFQDLIVLRAARALMDANLSKRRITRALRDLRRHLPQSMPLSGLSISAVGDRVVVREGEAQWQADDGQYVLGLDVRLDGGVLRVMEHRPTATHAEDWFARALDLEASDPLAALEAYERAARTTPGDSSVWTNWGRLLHEQGKLREAERVYRRGLEHAEPNALLYYNLGVVLEDLTQIPQALEAYQRAIELDPALADGHYNLARLYESMGKLQHAIRHLGQYRKLLNTLR